MATIRIDHDQEAAQPSMGGAGPVRKTAKFVRNNCCCIVFSFIGILVFIGVFGGMTGIMVAFNDKVQAVGASVAEVTSNVVTSTSQFLSLPTRVWRRTVCAITAPTAPYGKVSTPPLCGWVDLGAASTFTYNLTTPAPRQGWLLAWSVWTGVVTNLTAPFSLPGTGTVAALANIEAAWISGDSLLYVVLNDGTAVLVPVN
jgi:hypothetical protein